MEIDARARARGGHRASARRRSITTPLPCGSIVGGGLRNDHVMPSAPTLVIAELLRVKLAQARDHLVAERAGGEVRVRLDQDDLQLCMRAFQRARRRPRRRSRRRPRRHAARRLRTQDRWPRQRCGRRGDAEHGIPPRHRRAWSSGYPGDMPRRPQTGRRGFAVRRRVMFWSRERHRADALARGREKGVEHRRRRRRRWSARRPRPRSRRSAPSPFRPSASRRCRMSL